MMGVFKIHDDGHRSLAFLCDTKELANEFMGHYMQFCAENNKNPSRLVHYEVFLVRESKVAEASSHIFAREEFGL